MRLPIVERAGEARLDLLTDHDFPWIRALLDEAEAAAGHPWRDLVERINRLPLRTSPARRDLVVASLGHQLRGETRAGPKPTAVRARMFGEPVFDREERAARLAEVAEALDASVEAIEGALWADLAKQRLVVVREGSHESEVAGRTNLMMIQRALQRCQELKLFVAGNARAIARTAALRGLIVTARSHDDRCILEVSGPLAVFHHTTVYGRAFGSLVPQLAWCEDFALAARCDFGRGSTKLVIRPPVLLTQSAPPRTFDSAIEARFARDLNRVAPAWRVIREPSAVDAGGRLAFPDFVLEHRSDPSRRWWVEIVGFWTPDYLASKLATYRRARISNIILCIDQRHVVDVGSLPDEARVIAYKKTIAVADVLAIIDREVADPRRVAVLDGRVEVPSARGA